MAMPAMAAMPTPHARGLREKRAAGDETMRRKSIRRTPTLARPGDAKSRLFDSERGVYRPVMRSIQTPRNATRNATAFAYLMGLYGDNYWRLARLFSPHLLAPGTYRSLVPGDQPLSLRIHEQQAYTTLLSLNYEFAGEARALDPGAELRYYRDASVAEMVACDDQQRIEDVLGRVALPKAVFGYRLRINAFLGKWLEYIEDRGHSRFTLKPVGVVDGTPATRDARPGP